jgi:hypothetical protein
MVRKRSKLRLLDFFPPNSLTSVVVAVVTTPTAAATATAVASASATAGAAFVVFDIRFDHAFDRFVPRWHVFVLRLFTAGGIAFTFCTVTSAIALRSWSSATSTTWRIIIATLFAVSTTHDAIASVLVVIVFFGTRSTASGTVSARPTAAARTTFFLLIIVVIDERRQIGIVF